LVTLFLALHVVRRHRSVAAAARPRRISHSSSRSTRTGGCTCARYGAGSAATTVSIAVRSPAMSSSSTSQVSWSGSAQMISHARETVRTCAIGQPATVPTLIARECAHPDTQRRVTSSSTLRSTS
jgi:hypothetical protein